MNAMVFMLAGYDTTSTALSFCFHVLATNLEEQAKIREEIDSYFSSQSNVIIIYFLVFKLIKTIIFVFFCLANTRYR
jgi:cytochrome P450